MKQTVIVFLVVLLLVFSACVANETVKSEICRGYIDDILIEGIGKDAVKVLEVSTGKQTLYFTVSDDTEWFRHCYDPDSTEQITQNDLFVGVYVQVEYDSHEDSGYRPIRTLTVIDEDRVLEVMHCTVRKLGGDTLDAGKELTEEDAESLLAILGDYEWEEGTSDCLADYSFNLKGVLYQYHSECGTFNRQYFTAISSFSSKAPEESRGEGLRLSEKDKAAVNAMLEFYQ